MKNIFVIGLDPINHQLLQTIEDDDEYRFHGLLDFFEVVHPPEEGYPSFASMLQRSKEAIAGFPERVDGIMGYWDFPTSVLVPLIARETGLPGTNPDAVARCEHKYWSRLEQREVLPDNIPDFQAIDPFAADPLAEVRLDYPFWLKPVKAHSSFLGFHIDGPETLQAHLVEIREKIGLVAAPFNEFLTHVKVPEVVAPVDGYHCIAEAITSRGMQCTVEGFSWQGDVTVIGLVDSIRAGKHGSSFTSYRYPSQLPAGIQRRLAEMSEKVMRHIGYDNGAFNIEYFWDPESDRISLLEINSRSSKSHSPLFLMVDGVTNLKVPLDLAQGQRPAFPQGQGKHRIAAKFMLRFFEDGILEKVPDEETIAEFKRLYPDSWLTVLASQGMRLSELPFQDSYSYEVAEIFLGADNEDALLEKYDHACRLLGFKVSPLEQEAP
ncbi:MAG: hypothetical protein WD005_04835 [Haliea sp.]